MAIELGLFEDDAAKNRPDEFSGDESFSVRSDPALIAQGWERRHMVGPDRVDESIELYTSMGFEVKAQPLTAEDFADQCKECGSIICRSYVLIYTRKKSAG